MFKYRNVLLIFCSLVLFAYTGLVCIYPTVLNKTFNKNQFAQKVLEATGLSVSLDNIEFKMKPGLTLVIELRNLSAKHVVRDSSEKIIDYQNCFTSNLIELKTNAFSPLTKKFDIKEMFLRNVVYADQILEDGTNKLGYLLYSFEASPFGTSKIQITPGPVHIIDLKIKKIARNFYKEDKRKKEEYSKSEVSEFLKALNIRNIEIK